MPGMALSFSISSIFQLFLLTAELHHKIGNFRDEYIIVSALKIVIASAMAGVVAYLSLYIVAPVVDMRTYLGVLIQAAIAAVAGVATYLLAGLGLGLPESRNITNILRSSLQKFTRPIAIIWNLWE